MDGDNSDSEEDDEAEPPLPRPRPRRRRSVIEYGEHHSLKASEINLKDSDEAVQQSDGQDSRRLRRNREDEDAYHPSSASESGLDEEDGDIRPPQRKRLKISTPTKPTFRTSNGRWTRLNGTSGSQQVQTSASGRMRSGRRSIPSPPSSQGSGNEDVSAQVPTAKFEEYALGDVVRKRVTTYGLATFQLQVVWDSCVNHRRKNPTTERLQYQSPVKKRPTTKRGVSTRARFTPEEDDLPVKLKNQGLAVAGYSRLFTGAFPQRERCVGSLQGRYCTKLKRSD
ncbi:uncharacterized protein B0I36DRAFT_363215 [Microdochium trichocladiopsis]|uniref:Uncharacterized protein n=1 Tax=Microdochium trichocladiopsis TaxID=1682393 RepID=A0A9P8Y9R3_9PEZI|nr:uncharacterized protein B0I36DRAFT_363215 [Microdochium trichocladiopsis]KAH7031536.1 hypothetical protein B0I36DRAFT_363215 [Microdochium trichocladiopsis]